MHNTLDVQSALLRLSRINQDRAARAFRTDGPNSDCEHLDFIARRYLAAAVQEQENRK